MRLRMCYSLIGRRTELCPAFHFPHIVQVSYDDNAYQTNPAQSAFTRRREVGLTSHHCMHSRHCYIWSSVQPINVHRRAQLSSDTFTDFRGTNSHDRFHHLRGRRGTFKSYKRGSTSSFLRAELRHYVSAVDHGQGRDRPIEP